MGCNSSKPSLDVSKPEEPKINLDIDLTSLEQAQQQQQDRLKEQDGPASLETEDSRVTASGFQTDLKSDRPAFTQAFVHTHAGRGAVKELEEKYEIDSSTVLGRGACGSVVAVRHRLTGDLYAMKVVSLETMGGTLDELTVEINIQKTLDHPNICKIFESFEDSKTKEVYIVMEICTGGSLVSRMKTHRHGYGERAAATLVEKMLSAIIYCHHRKFGQPHKNGQLPSGGACHMRDVPRGTSSRSGLYSSPSHATALHPSTQHVVIEHMPICALLRRCGASRH